MTAITPLQALRRLVDIARLIDADECPELYNQLQGELAVAGAVLAEAEAAQTVPEGWQLVPKKITPAMERAARNSDGRSTGMHVESPFLLWADMLAAAPQPSAGSAAPAGEVVAWRVTGNYTDLPFKDESLADAYLGGLLKSDPDGGYKKTPLVAAITATKEPK